MQWKATLSHALSTIWHIVEPFVPGMLGAMVAQFMRPGLGMRTRFVQWTASVIVFHFVSQALAAVFSWPAAVAQVVGFFVAYMAFEALHAWQKAAIETGASAIRDVGRVWRHLMDSWAEKLGAARREAEAPETPTTEGEG